MVSASPSALSDGVMMDAVFLPHLSSSSTPLLRHSNSWTSILSHGAFSSHTPPPSPGESPIRDFPVHLLPHTEGHGAPLISPSADLIATAPQLANQRLVCVLEACHLGGARTELVLSRGFHLRD